MKGARFTHKTEPELEALAGKMDKKYFKGPNTEAALLVVFSQRNADARFNFIIKVQDTETASS